MGRKRKSSKSELEELLKRTEPGSGYGDPDARLNDDRRIQVLLAQAQSRIGNRLNLLTFFLVVVGVLNVIVLGLQLWQSMSHKG